MIKAREIAVQALREVEVKNTKSDTALTRLFVRKSMESVDRAFTMQIVYGTLREKMKIDHVISQFYRHSLAKMDIDVKNILRIGIYQLLFLDKVPRWAAVNESVELAKKLKGQFLGNLVNGVLRNISNNAETIEFNVKGGTFADQIALKYSHPKWLLERWINIYGFSDAQRIMESNNEIPKITFRINRLKTSPTTFQEKLQTQNVTFEPSSLNEFLTPERFFDLEPFLETGELSVQSESQALVCRLLSPKPGDKILDMCAAPGGKSTYMAEMMENQGSVLSLDLYENKLENIQSLAQALGISIIKTQAHDATTFNSSEKYDAVLLDAPCSGTGVLARRAELRWRLKESELKALTELQYKLLKNATGLVKEGGYLVYSTCSIEPEENTELINTFLAEHKEWEIEPATNILPNELHRFVSGDGTLTLLPHLHGLDGAFAVRLKRK